METKIIFGAPGCGKTTTLMDILEMELKQNSPDRIAYVSFTRKGTYEGRDRAMELFNYKENDLPYFRTLHSIAFREGNYSRADLMAPKDYKVFSDALGMKFTGYYTQDFIHNDDRYLFYDTILRENPKRAKVFAEELDTHTVALVSHNLERFKQQYSVIDFTDIVSSFINRNKPLDVDVAIIDEAQDLTTLQWEMCHLAFKNCKRVYIAGDDDQAIYEWSGADVDHFLKIRGEKTILHQSYRMRRHILQYAKNISALITNRVDKQFEPIDEGGNIFHHNTLDEIKIKDNESYYFLARNNYFLSLYKDLMIKKSKLFMYKKDTSFSTKEIVNINMYEKQRKGIKLNEQAEMSLRVYLRRNANMRAPWFESMEFTERGALTHSEKIGYYRDLIRNKVKLEEPKIMINTIHGVKGGEADNVVIMMDFTRAVRKNFEQNPDSELRTLYVGLTRAKHNLHIVYSQSKNGYDNYLEV